MSSNGAGYDCSILGDLEVRGDIELSSEDELEIINEERDAMLVLRPKSMLPVDDPAINQSEFILSYILE